MNAIHALSQLSYSPAGSFILTTAFFHVNTKKLAFCQGVLTGARLPPIIPDTVAGVVKLVDALDSKSSGT